MSSKSYHPIFTPAEKFTKLLENYFRSHISKGPVDYVTLIRDAQRHFRRYLSRKYHAEIFREMLFSSFEITQCTDYKVMRKILEEFMYEKLKFGRFLRAEIQEILPVIRSVSLFSSAYADIFPSYIDSTTGLNYSVDFFYSPYLIFDLEATRRLLRYGSRFELSAHQRNCSIKSILKCLR
jgi:hypothetical protein